MLLAIKVSVFAKELLPITDTEFLKGDIPAPPDKTGQEIVIDAIMSGLNYVKILMVSVGIFFTVLQGFRIIYAQGSEDDIGKAKKALVYMIIGFALISMSQDIAKIFDMSSGSILSSPNEILKRVQLFDKSVEIIIVFIKYIIGAIATLMIVIQGFRMITKGSDDEATSSAKGKILYAVFGLIMLYLGDIIVNKVFYNVNKEMYSGMTGVRPYVDIKEGVAQIIGITNFAVNFLGTVSILILVISAVLYVTSIGNEERMNKAKRIMIATVASMLIIFGAFALISTIVAGNVNIN